MIKSRIKVLLADNSALARKILASELSKDQDIEVVGTAPDPYIARDKIIHLRPDILLLDLHLPKIDGLTFLEKLMKYHPMPVILMGNGMEKGSSAALKAAELGALDIISKPGGSKDWEELGRTLTDKIKKAFTSQDLKQSIKDTMKEPVREPDAVTMANDPKPGRIIAIGASTGGTEAIKDILMKLPRGMPPILVVQHMPENFTSSFAKRLDSICSLEVSEAQNGDIASCGKVFIAPGNRHMTLKSNGSRYYVGVMDGELVFHQRPSVEVLFHSVAKIAGAHSMGVILTGMGRDGAAGLLEMRRSGAFTIAQDEKSCVVYGMPKEAVLLGGVCKVSHLDEIPAALIQWAGLQK